MNLRSIQVRLFVIAMLGLYALTPYAVWAMDIDDCNCKMGKVSCGEGGFVCHCCSDSAGDAYGGPRITKCKKAADVTGVSHPPVLNMQALLIAQDTGHGEVQIVAFLSIPDAFNSPPQKPPRNISL